MNQKQKEMNKLINTVKSYKGQIKRLEHTNRSYKGIISKQNKQIDLMARAIDNYENQLAINTFRDKEHVKQYFKEIAERKNEEC